MATKTELKKEYKVTFVFPDDTTIVTKVLASSQDLAHHIARLQLSRKDLSEYESSYIEEV